MNSSTSNSKIRPDDRTPLRRTTGRKSHKRQVWRANAGISGFIVLIILLEVFLFRNLYFYGLSPGNIGQLGELKASFAHAEHEQIKVAIFGDSQSMDALRPELLAEQSSYEQAQLFNFSISGGSAYDLEQVYQQYASALTELESAIVVVGEHQFNESRTVEDIKFKYFAGLRDRLQVMNRDNYGELLLGYVFKSYGMRTEWTMMIDKYQAGELRSEVPVHAGGLPPVTWSPRQSRTEEYAQETADRWFEHFEMGGLRSAGFASLIQDLREQDIDVTVIQLPRHEWFEQAIRDNYATEQQQYRQFLQQVTDQYGAKLWLMSNEGLALETHFRDTNHVNEEGARLVSRQVAERLLR